MDKNRIIEKLSWITQSKLAPQPITQEYKERQYRFFENYVHFSYKIMGLLQEKY